MKGKSHPQNDRSLNLTANESILDVIDRVNASRRRFVQSGIGATALTAAGGLTLGGFVGTVQAAPVPPGLGFPGFGFANVPASLAPVADLVTVPAGYSAQLMVAWGDPIMPGGVPFSGNATETAAQQMMSYGAHTDGMHFFPFSTGGRPSSDRGVLCANNEYTHEEILHPDGLVGATGYTIDKCRKSQAAHGVSIAELRRLSGKWSVVKSSPLGRRLTANTPMTRLRAGGRPRADEDGGVQHHRHRLHGHRQHQQRPHLQRHRQQLRQWHHALGHLPDLRRELERLLRHRRSICRPRATRASSTTAMASRRTASATAGTPSIRAGTCRPTRTSRTSSAGWSRSTPSTRAACRSSAPRSAASSTRARSTSSTRTTAWPSTWATTSATSTSTSSSAPASTTRPTVPPTATCWTAACCTWRASTATCRASGSRCCPARWAWTAWPCATTPTSPAPTMPRCWPRS